MAKKLGIGQVPRSRKELRALLRVAGLPAVTALFATSPQRVERLFFDERLKPLVGNFCTELARARKPYRLVGPEELERVAGTVLHGGVVAIAAPRPMRDFDPADAAAWAQGRNPLLLLDGVGNPHNLGAIARTAAFFGVPSMGLSDHPAQALPSDASYRVAEGGLEYVELFRIKGIASALGRLREHYCVIGAAPGRGATIGSLHRTGRPIALVLGNEERGLPSATLEACEKIVGIPGSGRVQSLNVAASAAVLIYALIRPKGS